MNNLSNSPKFHFSNLTTSYCKLERDKEVRLKIQQIEEIQQSDMNGSKKRERVIKGAKKQREKKNEK